MAKKDFSQVNTNPVYNTIAAATADPEQEAAEIMQTLHTSGRKGLKLPRINLAFTPELHEYITTMSRARGETITDFVNKVLREHMQEHIDIYERAIEFRKCL